MRQAAYCGTREIYDDMEMSAKSFVANGGIDKIHFIIEDPEFPRPLPDIIECHDLSGQTFFEHDGPNMESQFTWMTMMRIALCHVLPDVDKVLSLDADTIAFEDYSGIWDYPDPDCYLSASEEWHRTADGLQYCNFGVVMYNLVKLRDGKADECIDVLNRRRYSWVEQDVGNFLCQGRIDPMPAKFNSNFFTDKDKGECVIKHYAGIPRLRWIYEPLPTMYRNMSWDEALELHHG